jgi:Mg2+ and Co2+ transporter CorA
MSRGLHDLLDSLRNWLRGPVDYVFNEDVMTLLAFLIIPTVVLPYVIDLSPVTLYFFDILNFLIIGAFIAEYVLKLFVANNRTEFVLNPWHMLDLAIILLALAEFLPFVTTSAGRASPLLRLLRVLRVFTAAGRTIRVPRPPRPPPAPGPAVSIMTVSMLVDGRVTRCSIEEVSCEIAPGRDRWIDMQNVSEIDLPMISQTLSIPLYLLKSYMAEGTFPRIDYFSNFTSILLGDTRLEHRGPGIHGLTIDRESMIVVCAGTQIVTIHTGKSTLFDEIVAEGTGEGEKLAIQVLHTIFQHKIQNGKEVVRALEMYTLELQETPVGRGPPSFLEDTFSLKRETYKFTKVLWHFREVLDRLRTTGVKLAGVTDDELARFDVLYDEADYLYETCDDVDDSMESLRELHINTLTFDMTRVMRILAIATVLALIPQTIGGLLGENLLDVPFPITLPEISLIVISLMLIALYSFYKMGWLR